jgi:hypothetical protein
MRDARVRPGREEVRNTLSTTDKPHPYPGSVLFLLGRGPRRIG